MLRVLEVGDDKSPSAGMPRLPAARGAYLAAPLSPAFLARGRSGPPLPCPHSRFRRVRASIAQLACRAAPDECLRGLPDLGPPGVDDAVDEGDGVLDHHVVSRHNVGQHLGSRPRRSPQHPVGHDHLVLVRQQAVPDPLLVEGICEQAHAQSGTPIGPSGVTGQARAVRALPEASRVSLGWMGTWTNTCLTKSSACWSPCTGAGADRS